MRTGFIYGIFENDKIIYVGSCWDMKERIYQHISDCKTYNSKLYSHVKDNWDSFEFRVLKQDEYCCLDERLMDEREFIDVIGWDNLFNNYCPYMTEDEIKDRDKLYRENNKEHRSWKGKEYYEKNKEEISRKGKEYYEKNKEKILQKIKTKYTCPCGSVVSLIHKARHEKSKKHKDSLK